MPFELGGVGGAGIVSGGKDAAAGEGGAECVPFELGGVGGTGLDSGGKDAKEPEAVATPRAARRAVRRRATYTLTATTATPAPMPPTFAAVDILENDMVPLAANRSILRQTGGASVLVAARVAGFSILQVQAVFKLFMLCYLSIRS